MCTNTRSVTPYNVEPDTQACKHTHTQSVSPSSTLTGTFSRLLVYDPSMAVRSTGADMMEIDHVVPHLSCQKSLKDLLDQQQEDPGKPHITKLNHVYACSQVSSARSDHRTKVRTTVFTRNLLGLHILKKKKKNNSLWSNLNPKSPSRGCNKIRAQVTWKITFYQKKNL